MYPSIAIIAALAATALAAPVNVQERQLDAVGGLLGGAGDSSSSGAAGEALDPVVSAASPFGHCL